jgi:N-acetylmuramic acid 6-phosphate etherase
MINLTKLATEQVNINSINIDSLSTQQIVTLINNEDQKVAVAIKAKLPIIAEVANAMVQTLQGDGRVIYMGAGTSGRLGVLDAAELPPTYNANPNKVLGLIAGGHKALTEAVENSEDNKELALLDLQTIKFNKSDMLIGLAASGRTPYVLAGIEYANSLGAKSVAIACTSPSAIGAVAQLAIEVELGGEVVTGSTRMKAGTAQKLILNMLSTTTMIKLGKVYGNLMVDVQVKNAKLRQRALNIIRQITKVDEHEAINLLEKAHNNVKVALVLYYKKISYDEATLLLNKAKGFINEILKDEQS